VLEGTPFLVTAKDFLHGDAFSTRSTRAGPDAALTLASKPGQKFSPIVHCGFATFKDA
jgi:hypothetical protein